MPTYFCPVCWATSKEDQAICPSCGADIGRVLASKTYAERLSDALHHPDPATQLRVAYLLGLMRETGAVPALAARASETDDLYVSLQCLGALARIGTEQAWSAVEAACGDLRATVSARATDLLRRRVAADPPRQG